MKREISAFALAILVFALTACGGASPMASATTHRFNIKSGGLDRSYVVFRPAGLATSRAVPVVFVLHGLGDSGTSIEQATGFDAVSQANQFVAIYPDGYAHSWNTGSGVGRAEQVGVDDVAFIEAILAQEAKDQAIDPDRVFATGFSMGAVMTHHLGCELSSRIAAIASMEGALWGRPCRPNRPVSVLQIHGTLDAAVPYPGMVRELEGGSLVDRNISTVDLWKQLDQCNKPPSHAVTGSVARDVVTGCSQDTAVALYTVDGLNHDIASPPQLDEAAEIWVFFAAHGRAIPK